MILEVRRTNSSRYEITIPRRTGLERVGCADVVRMSNAQILPGDDLKLRGKILAVWGLVLDPKLEVTREILRLVGVNRPFLPMRDTRHANLIRSGKELAIWQNGVKLSFASMIHLSSQEVVCSLNKKKNENE